MHCRAYLDIRLNIPVSPLYAVGQTLLNCGKVPTEVSAARRLAIGRRQRPAELNPLSG